MKKVLVAYHGPTGSTRAMGEYSTECIRLKERIVDANEGLRACRQYGRAFSNQAQA